MGNVMFMRKGEVHTAPVGADPLSSYAVGTKVKLNVDGAEKNFIIVNQGKPSNSTLYDDSCDGTWLLMEDLYGENKNWNTSVSPYNNTNDYENSLIHDYLHDTFLNALDADVQDLIQQVKLPYQKGTGSGGSISSGANGLSTKVFLLSAYELGWTFSGIAIDGAKLDYFESGTGSSANSKRVAYRDGTATFWWARTPYTGNTSAVVQVTESGSYIDYGVGNYRGIRPAFVLPSDTLTTVNDDGTVTLKV